MNIYKKFITDQRNIELKEPYLIINVNISPKIYEYLQTLEAVKFQDGEYHKYCGEIKLGINNYIAYWEEVINECVKEADALMHTVDKKGLIQLIIDTKEIQKFKQNQYLKLFGPIENEEEQKVIDDINEHYENRFEDLTDMIRLVNRFDIPEKSKKFLKTQLELSISKKNAAFELAHTYMAEQCAKYSFRIRTSFEVILKRMTNNLKKMKDEKAEELNKLMEELFDANKDRLTVSRQFKHRNSDTAEVDSVIKKIRAKIERHQIANPLANLEEEVEYWQKRTEEFQHIDKTIKDVERELKRVKEYIERCNTMTTTEYPGSKKTCWENMKENYARRKTYLENTLHDASKSIITFFAVPGHNRITYKDNNGPYAIDEYGHQLYFFDYGKKVCHNTCDGNLVELHDTDKYYFDEVGRYKLDENGAKVYQIGACTSSYTLNEDNLLIKTTKDCGHSEAVNPNCKMTIRNPNIIELLPKYDPVDIRKTLSPEVTKYIWDSVAYVLCDALCDTGMKQSINPIYTLANRLMYHKYHKNNIPQLKKKMEELDKYRSDVYKKRKEKAVVSALAFKAKQVQPRKPAESDDSEAQQVLASLAAKEQLKVQLMTYYQDF